MIEIGSDAPSMYPINSDPYGTSYAVWSSRWWQWLLSIPKDTSPAFDINGRYANHKQQYPNVMFLCQTYESSGSHPHRIVYLPKNTAIFLPVINWISVSHQDGETEEELMKVARRRMDIVGQMKLTINGFSLRRELRQFRVLSPFFDVKLPQENILGLPPGTRRAISDGYWVFLRPLQKGGSLISHGSCSSGVTKIGVQYTLIPL